jgi:hypothetical protein
VAESLADYLTRRPEFLGPGTEAKFLTTGDPRRRLRQRHALPAPPDPLPASLTHPRPIARGFQSA